MSFKGKVSDVFYGTLSITESRINKHEVRSKEINHNAAEKDTWMEEKKRI